MTNTLVNKVKMNNAKLNVYKKALQEACELSRPYIENKVNVSKIPFYCLILLLKKVLRYLFININKTIMLKYVIFRMFIKLFTANNSSIYFEKFE